MNQKDRKTLVDAVQKRIMALRKVYEEHGIPESEMMVAVSPPEYAAILGHINGGLDFCQHLIRYMGAKLVRVGPPHELVPLLTRYYAYSFGGVRNLER